MMFKYQSKSCVACRYSLIATMLLLVMSLAGCSTIKDIKAEMRAEERARKYGDRLSVEQLGPFADFTREQYFKHKCETEAGEFIYKTVDNVESVFQMRLRDPRDYFDRLRAGDIPEDPWGHTNIDARSPWTAFVANYRFFETTKKLPDLGDNWKRRVFASAPPRTQSRYWRYRLGEQDGNEYFYRRPGESIGRPLVIETTEKLESRFGYTWLEVRDKYDRHFGVWGGEMRVVDLQTDEVLAVKRGFFDARYKICPKKKGVLFTYDFVSKVLKPKPFEPSATEKQGQEKRHQGE